MQVGRVQDHLVHRTQRHATVRIEQGSWSRPLHPGVVESAMLWFVRSLKKWDLLPGGSTLQRVCEKMLGRISWLRKEKSAQRGSFGQEISTNMLARTSVWPPNLCNIKNQVFRRVRPWQNSSLTKNSGYFLVSFLAVSGFVLLQIAGIPSGFCPLSLAPSCRWGKEDAPKKYPSWKSLAKFSKINTLWQTHLTYKTKSI